MKKLLLFGIVLLSLYIHFVSGAFSQSGVIGNYSVDSDVTATITCTAADKNDIGYYAWYVNDGVTVLENDTLICPTASPYVMFASWKVTSAQAPQENLSGRLVEEGLNISLAHFNTTLSGGVNDLDVINVKVTDPIYEGRSAGISGKIQNQGEDVGYADVCIDVLDENGDPFSHLGCKKSEADGEFFMSSTCDPNKGWCFGGASYILDIDASCPLNKSSEDDICTKGNVEIEWASGGASEVVTVVDIADKMIAGRNHTGTEEWGIWVENENGYRVNMTTTLPTLWQEDINWSAYNNSKDGEAFLTAGEKFRLCMIVNNTFDSDRHISIDHLHLIRKTGKMVNPLFLDGSLIGNQEIMHIEVKSAEIVNTNYTKCGDWLLVPQNIKGQNNWKAAFHMQVEDYAQEAKLNSNRFTVFGEERGKDYVSIVDITNVSTNKFALNITPLNDIDVTFTYDYFGDEEKIYIAEYCFEQTDDDFVGGCYEKTINPDDGYDNQITEIFELPYFDKSGDGEVYITIREERDGDFITGFGDTEPHNTFIIKTFNITNITTSAYGGNITACTDMNISYTYDFFGDDKTELVAKYCFEQTDDDLIGNCITKDIDADAGSNQVTNDTIQLPYFPKGGEGELEIFIYKKYPNGELAFLERGDPEPYNIFNITADLSDRCKYSQNYDQEIQYQQKEELSAINDSAGTFDFEISVSDTDILTTTVSGSGKTGEGRTLNRDLNVKCQVDGYPSTYKEFKVYCTDTFSFTEQIKVPKPYGTYTMSCTVIDRFFGEDATPASGNFKVHKEPDKVMAFLSDLFGKELLPYKTSIVSFLFIAILLCLMYMRKKEIYMRRVSNEKNNT